jgi:hypothetical protein
MLCFFFVFVSIAGYSQKAPPPPAPPPNPGLPINGGIVYLLISGFIYGVYELKKKEK